MEVLRGGRELFSFKMVPSPDAVRTLGEARGDYATILSDPNIVTDRVVWEAANAKYNNLFGLITSQEPPVVKPRF